MAARGSQWPFPAALCFLLCLVEAYPSSRQQHKGGFVGLLEQAPLAPLEVPIRRFTADGAYDHRSVYDRASAAGTENVVIVIPPRRSALSAGPTDGPWAQREASLQRIRKVGRPTAGAR